MRKLERLISVMQAMQKELDDIARSLAATHQIDVCPFCNQNSGEVSSEEDVWIVQCLNEDCLAVGPPSPEGREHAIALWNRRGHGAAALKLTVEEPVASLYSEAAAPDFTSPRLDGDRRVVPSMTSDSFVLCTLPDRKLFTKAQWLSLPLALDDLRVEQFEMGDATVMISEGCMSPNCGGGCDGCPE